MAQQDILPPITEDDRMLSGLVYPLWPLIGPIVLYGSKREEPFLHFNALQAVALGASSLGAGFVVFLLTWFLMWLLPGSFITVSAVMGIGVFALVVFILFFYLTLILFIAWRVANGKFLRLPFLGTWAERKMQENLHLSPDSYSTAVYGERRPKAKLSHFDYRNAPGYVEDPEEVLERETSEEDHYDPNTDMYEYTSDATAPEDLLSYEQANAPKSNVAPTAAPAGGFQPHAPRPVSSAPATPAPPSDGFKPLAGKFGSKMPGSSGNSNFGSATTIDQSGFKPLTPHSNGRQASAPVVAGQRPATSQFKPLVPQGNRPAPQVSGPAKTTAPKFHGFKDFNMPSSPPPEPGSQPAKNPTPDTGGDDFRPGLMTNKPHATSPRFQWDKLGDK